MPRRRRHGVSAIGAVLSLTAAATAGCQADLGTAGCGFTRQATLAGSPLTLLGDARLDAIGAGYVLIGHDSDAVRWATLSMDGTLGTEHAFGLPTGVTKPLFAMAGTPAGTPGDTVLIGYLAADSTQTKGELAMIAVPADGSPPQAPAANIHEFPRGVPGASTVAMGSSRKGGNAGLAWIDDELNAVMYAALDATGQPVGAPTPAAPATPGFSCLAFAPGKDDVTLTYRAAGANNGKSGWVIAEANESGGVDSYVTLTASSTVDSSCAVITPTEDGYAIAWQDQAGASLIRYTASDLTPPATVAFAPSNEFGGATLQPPLMAVSPFGQDFGVLFQRLHAAELWRLDPGGAQRSGALIFPSTAGNIGTVATVPVPAPGGGLAVTYADYLSSDAGVAGARRFVNATCY